MRNLLEHPITYAETVSAIQDAHHHHLKYDDGIGGTRRVALTMAEQFIRENRAQFEKFTKDSAISIWGNT